jgi:pimeloyl-ACP methyl ester carboxylesterase
MQLHTGAELRVTGPLDAPAAVVCVNGGQAAQVEGTWSASIEWLVRRLAPRFPELAFAEVRYRIKSWNRLEWCVEDARAAVAQVGARRTLLLGFSMGGAVGVRTAEDPSVETLLGLAPWLPDQLSLEPLRGKRLRVLHGSLDRAFPGIPGVAPALARRGFDRARALGARGEYTLVRGGLHGVAVRAPSGRLVALPRASKWASLVAEELTAFNRLPGSSCSPQSSSA